MSNRDEPGGHSGHSNQGFSLNGNAPAPSLRPIWTPAAREGYDLDKPVLLMCPPDFFEPAPPHPHHGYANAFEKEGRELFERNPAAFRARAQEQWENLEAVFKKHARVVRITPIPGWHDQVYTADPSLSFSVYNGSATPRNITLLSDFSNEKRNHEIEMHRVLLGAMDATRVIEKSPFKIEGNGDNVPDAFRGIIWSGYTKGASIASAQSGRSSLESHTFVREQTGIEVVSLRTRKPFYHIDTVLGPLPRGHVIAHPESLFKGMDKLFMKRAFTDFNLNPDEYLIKVSMADALRLAPNVRCFGNNIVMPMCSEDLQDRVRSKGYNVEVVEIDAFLAGGGSIHCLSNVVNEPMFLPH